MRKNILILCVAVLLMSSSLIGRGLLYLSISMITALVGALEVGHSAPVRIRNLCLEFRGGASRQGSHGAGVPADSGSVGSGLTFRSMHSSRAVTATLAAH
jgi:hypothetical protein